MQILLIDPPYKALKGVAPECGYNLGLACLAAYLRREGIDAGLLSVDTLLGLPHSFKEAIDMRGYSRGQEMYRRALANDSHQAWRKLEELLQKHRPRAVGISYSTPLKCTVEKTAARVKQVDAGIAVVVGGHHPTFCPDEVMQNPHIDFAVRGEGEVPLLALVRAMGDGADYGQVPGIHWRDQNGRIVANPDAPQIEELDSLPFPARSPLVGAGDWKYWIHRTTTARGCPYLCTFCADKNLWRRKFRRRSVDNVIRELKELKAAFPETKIVEFTDGTFTCDKAYVRQFCEKLTQERLGILWGCFARYDNLDPDLLALMRRSGCVVLYLGLESGSEKTLANMQKNLEVEQMIERSRMIRRAGIGSIVSVLLGFPGDTREDMQQTLQVMRKVKVGLFDVNSYVPLPGTPLYDQLDARAREGIDWSTASYKSLDNHFNQAVSPEDFRSILLESYRIARKVARRSLVRYLWRRLRSTVSGWLRPTPAFPG